MTLTRYEDVQHWFNQNQTDDEGGKTPSHWTLYGGNYGEKEIRLLGNTRIDKPGESLAFLIDSIRRMNNPSGSKFRVQIYKPGSPNNYSAQVFVQVFDDAAQLQQRGASATAIQPAGIGNLPVLNETYIQERIDLALLRRENEELKAALNGPGSTWERILDIIGQSEPLSLALSGLITNLAAKNGMTLPAAPIARPVTGSPAPVDSDDDDTADPQSIFAESINAAASGLDTDPVTMARKLKKIVEQNPEFAKQIFAQT